MRKKQRRPEKDKGRYRFAGFGNIAGWKYDRHIRMPFRPYIHANTHRDWSKYIPYKKYNDIVKAAHFTGKRKYLHLLRAQKNTLAYYGPYRWAARNPFRKSLAQYADLEYYRYV